MEGVPSHYLRDAAATLQVSGSLIYGDPRRSKRTAALLHIGGWSSCPALPEYYFGRLCLRRL